MKKIVLTENTTKEEIVEATVEEPKEQVIKAVENQKLEASFSHSNGEMVSFKTNSNEIKLKYLSSKNIDVNPQLNDDNKVAIYKDVEDGIDLKYELEDRRLKESFIINQRNNNYTFNFEAKIGDLEPSYNEARKCLEFKKDDKVVCRMLPPFMFDNKGEESKKCSYEVENNENGLLLIKLVADAEWINSEERELPIVIDPTFEIDVTSRQVNVYQNGRSSDGGTNDEVFIGYKNQDDDLKFYEAQIEINLDDYNLPGFDSNKRLFFEIPMNYNIMESGDDIVVSVDGVPIGSFKQSQLIYNNLLRLDLTELLKNKNYLTINLCSSYDMALYYMNSPYYKSKTLQDGVFKMSLQVRDSYGAQKAKLFFEPKEENKTYVNYDLGVSGVTSVSIQTGRYKHRINDVSISSGPLMLNVDHIYDSKNNSNTPYGQNWDLSLSRHLIKEKSRNQQVVYYVDDEGNKHAFIEKWFTRYGTQKYYYEKDDIYFSENNEPCVRNSSSKVEYELVNDEGYSFVSLGSLTDHDAKNPEYKYYLKYKNFKKPVINGYNYLQFIYYENGSMKYVDYSKVEMKDNKYVAKVGSVEKTVFLNRSSVYTNTSAGTVTLYGEDQKQKTVYLEKVPIYENLDEGLYTNLEYEMHQAKNSYNQAKLLFERIKGNYYNKLTSIQKVDFNSKNGDGNFIASEESFKNYAEFVQLENDLISVFEQQSTIEKNAYFITRNFYAKLRQQKQSVTDFVLEPNGNMVLFDGYGRMIGLTDTHKNQISISYNDDSNIETIKSDEEQIAFKYNDDKKLESIKKSNGDTVRFTYMFDMLSEINNNGRKTTITYMNGLQVYSDINDEIIIDTQTANTIKVKKYVEPNEIYGQKEFQFFVDRKLIQNDMFQYFDNFMRTKITDRITNDVTIIEFNQNGEIKKQEESDCITYSNYLDGKLISLVDMRKNPTVLFTKSNFTLNSNKYTLTSSASKKYLTKTNAYCLRVDLNDLPAEKELLNIIALSISYVKGGETYNFKQIFYNKENETLFLPFFMYGNISNFTATVETKLDSSVSLSNHIKDISIVEIVNGKLQEYDEKGRLWKIKTNEGKTTYLVFDDKLPIHIEFKDWNGKAVTADYEYDDEKRVVSKIDSNGNCENYLYQKGGNKVEKKAFNLKDASLVRSAVSEYDAENKTYISKGAIKDSEGNYPIHKTILYPGTNIVKTEIGFDGNKTEYIVDPRNKKLLGLIKENNGIKNSISYIYNRDFLTTVKNNGTEINYTYDGQKRLRTVKIKGFSYTFINKTYSSSKTTVYGLGGKSYANGSTATTSFNGGLFKGTNYFDKDGNVVRFVQTDSTNTNTYTSNYLYNEDGLISESETVKTGDDAYTETIKYVYDDVNNVTSFTKKIIEGEEVVEEVTNLYEYNSYGNLVKSDLRIGDSEVSNLLSTYTYNTDKLVTKEVINGKYQINFEYDALNRVNHQEVKNDNNVTICHHFSYLQQDDNTLDLIAEDNIKIVTSNNDYFIENHKYKYDVNGRITEINIDDNRIDYEYDASGRLVKERNEILGIENKYAYDALSNIVSKKTYDLLTNSLTKENELIYSCDGKHLLVSINGNPVTTDVYGRITSYLDKSFVWNKDGSLKSIVFDEDKAINYAYNEKGIRYLKKSSNGDTTRYVLDGNRVLREVSNNRIIDFLYSTDGLLGFKINDETYMYEKNILGDIIRIYNNNGNIVGEYVYDSFGNFTIVTDVDGIATINPFRYRGYYYDNDAGLYYLNYRYYDSDIGRYISPDDASYINPNNVNGLNIYAYCNNDPINCVDPSGHSPEWWQWLLGGLMVVGGVVLCATGAGAAVGAGLIVGGASSLASCTVSALGGDSKLCSIISSCCNIVGGIVLCAVGLGAAGAGMIGSGVGSIAGGFISESLGGSFTTGALIGGIVGSFLGGLAYKIYDAYKVSQIANEGSVVIGETQKRVHEVAEKLGAGEFHTSKLSNFIHNKLKLKKLAEWITMNEDRTWINRVCDSGVDIIDIGLDLTRTSRSDFYAMEILEILKNLFW